MATNNKKIFVTESIGFGERYAEIPEYNTRIGDGAPMSSFATARQKMVDRQVR
jgi:hypothetical protein